MRQDQLDAIKADPDRNVSEDSFEKIAGSAHQVLYHAIMRRDENGLKPEVIRVARAMCQANGGEPDALIHIAPQRLNGMWLDRTSLALSPGSVMMGWRRYLSAARLVIENLDAAREEESLRLKQHEEAVAAVETAGVGFSGMTNGEDVKIVARELGEGNVTDSLSHRDLEAMEEYLATVFDIGPDGDSALCRQTGGEFHTIAIGWKMGASKEVYGPDAVRKLLIKRATADILSLGSAALAQTLYWRKRPQIETDGDVMRIYARVAFGP